MSFWGVLGLLQKAYSLDFFCWKTAAREGNFLAAVWAFAQIKPTKINLSLFGRWFQLNGGPCGLGVRAHNLGKPNRLGGLYD